MTFPLLLRRALGCLVLCALLMVSVSGCDILRKEPFELEKWSPGPDYRGDGSDVALRLEFSSDCDRASVENAFSLTEDGQRVRGAFTWSGRILAFSPYAAYRPNREYALTIDEGASDCRGVSLEKTVEETFWTHSTGGAETERGSVVEFDPSDGATFPEPRREIVLRFSRPVTAADCRDLVSFSPSISGTWSVDGETSGTAARFKPIVDWETGAEYRVEVPESMVDYERVRFGRSASSRFRRGSDSTPPQLEAFEILDSGGALVAAVEPGSEFPGLNRGDRIRFRFSEPVDLSSVDTRIIAEPSLSLVRKTLGGISASAVYEPAELPSWGSRIVVRLSSGVRDPSANEAVSYGPYRLSFDGAASRPPVLVGIRLPLAPGAADEASRMLAAFAAGDAFTSIDISGGADRYPTDTAVATTVEVYCVLADGASVDPFSVMEKFRVSATNGALSFSPRNVRTSSFTYAVPYGPWAGCARFEVDGYLTNRTAAGVVTFELSSGFSDSLLNRTTEAAILPLLK